MSKTKKIPVVVDPSVEEEYDPVECPMCGGEGMKLGSLGNLQWYRCRQCGMEFNRKYHG